MLRGRRHEHDDQVYDDGSEVETECEEDEPPRSGVWVDSEEFEPSEEEKAAGEFLAKAGDLSREEDANSEQWGTVENPTMTAEDFEALS
jgi:hypothetical protein